MHTLFLNIRKEVESLPITVWGLAKFAFLVGGILLFLGGLAWYHEKTITALIVGIPGLSLFAAGAIVPRRLSWLYRRWMWLAFFLGSIIGPLILVLIYYFIVTPIALIALLAKGNPLEKETKEGSYWIPRACAFDPKNMERMY
jgi:hypothetical protein